MLAAMMAQLQLFLKNCYNEEDYVQVRIKSGNLPMGSIIPLSCWKVIFERMMYTIRFNTC